MLDSAVGVTASKLRVFRVCVEAAELRGSVFSVSRPVALAVTKLDLVDFLCCSTFGSG